MNLNNVNKAYFMGIGGIGMSAIARYFLAQGAEVHGYDKTPSDITNKLISEGANIHFADLPQNIPADIDVFIYTPAIPESLNEFVAVKNSGKPLMKRAEVLGMLSNNKPTIAVAGTHGKTTVSSLIAHILKSAGINFSAFLGGIPTNYDSNFITNGSPDWFLVEADEYDRSFLQLSPQIAVITAMDPDHLDIYNNKEKMIESFNLFANKIPDNGTLVIRKGLIKHLDCPCKTIEYLFGDQADLYADNTIVKNNMFYADFKGLVEKNNVLIGLPGKHNLENAMAAIIVASTIGVDINMALEALGTFKGIKRRFETCFNNGKKVYIDDYAHHPEEIRAFISAVRELYPGKKILGIFQPHLYSRTRDFADGFAQSLSKLDELIMLDIYPARENPIPGVNSEIILKNIGLSDKSLVAKELLINEIVNKEFDVLVTMGAGDIDRLVKPITELFEKEIYDK